MAPRQDWRSSLLVRSAAVTNRLLWEGPNEASRSCLPCSLQMVDYEPAAQSDHAERPPLRAGVGAAGSLVRAVPFLVARPTAWCYSVVDWCVSMPGIEPARRAAQRGESSCCPCGASSGCSSPRGAWRSASCDDVSAPGPIAPPTTLRGSASAGPPGTTNPRARAPPTAPRTPARARTSPPATQPPTTGPDARNAPCSGPVACGATPAPSPQPAPAPSAAACAAQPAAAA